MSMKSFELEPNRNNLLYTLSKDLLDRNTDVWHFARFCNDQEGKCSIALDGKWGAGKTFFVKHTQMLIESFNPFISSEWTNDKCNIQNVFSKEIGRNKEIAFIPQVCIYYDAWSNDNSEDPLLSIVYQIMMDTEQYYTLKRQADLLQIGADIIDYFTDKNIAKFVERFRKNEILSEVKKEKEIHTLVSDFLDSLLPEQGERLIVFIDELDRCRPDYAVRLLERVKHYFTNDRITFVFSINMEQLQYSVKQIYGNEFDSYRYLDRFFDYRISLPPVNVNKYYRCIGLSSGVYESVCKSVISYCGFELREIEKYYRTVKIASWKPLNNHKNNELPLGNTLTFLLTIIVPILIGLKMKDINLYQSFIDGKNIAPLSEIIEDNDDFEWFLELLLNQNETYTSNLNDERKHVEKSEKLNCFYLSLFSDDLIKKQKIIQIGSCEIYSKTKEELIKIVNLMSNYSDYEC